MHLLSLLFVDLTQALQNLNQYGHKIEFLMLTVREPMMYNNNNIHVCMYLVCLG